ncbi:unnamed protein product [Diatraea saccharalis]|uniref:long-chain-fatty-acid--CoA ligase n=1 Tax=Diatraea saccharalis TaxID=40085 RepID=A0A9N9RGV5_9NEOP|nr:unnamed protein product [Diatraea saccharalis]
MENDENIAVHKTQPVNGIQRNTFMNGPDQVVPSSNYNVWEPEGAVKLRLAPRGVAAEPPVSVPGLLTRIASRYPDLKALCTKKADGKWHKITYKQYRERVRTVAKGFLKLGLERYHSVCIIGFNSEPWFLSDLAAIHAGGFAAGIYTTNSAEACFHCLSSSRANICTVQDKKQLEKILSIKSRLPHLKAIVQWEGTVDTSIPGVYSWDQLMEIGSKESDTALDNVLKHIAVNECCTLVYTSGTVGPPKAVMLSHDNLIWDAHTISIRCGDMQPEAERLVSFLPLSHVAAQVLDIYTSMTKGISVFFAQPDALKGSIVETLKEVRPTRFLAVPRVFEKMHEKIVAVGASRGAITRYIAGLARNATYNYHMARIDGYEGTSFGYRLAKSLVISKALDALGLDQCKMYISSAAPMSPEIKKFFMSLDMPIVEAFGMSEMAGAHALSIYPKMKLDSVGELLDGTETRFDGSVSPNGPGEICMRGRHLMMGYLNDKEKTQEAIDDEGWIHSGDIGRVDDFDLLYVTGRIKELLITAGGENVAPVPIEQVVQAELRHVGYAVLIGDKRKFLSMLITIKTKVDNETGAALDALEPEAQKWVTSLGSKATTLSEISKTKDPAVHKAIEEGIARANKKAISNAQKVQKFAILPADLSMPSGELGPTLKIKRNVVYDKYKDIIEDFYRE